jgi:hypothetical protein
VGFVRQHTVLSYHNIYNIFDIFFSLFNPHLLTECLFFIIVFLTMYLTCFVDVEQWGKQHTNIKVYHWIFLMSLSGIEYLTYVTYIHECFFLYSIVRRLWCKQSFVLKSGYQLSLYLHLLIWQGSSSQISEYVFNTESNH